MTEDEGRACAPSFSPLPGSGEGPAQGVRASVAGGDGPAREERASAPSNSGDEPTLEPSQWPTADRWAAALSEALRGVLDDDEVDVGPALALDGTSEPGTLAVATDDWTLTIEGLHPKPWNPEPVTVVPTAWLAVDDEPDDPTRFRTARRALMPAAVDRALAAADAALAGALRAALVAGADPFSQDLASELEAGAVQDGAELSS